MFVNGFMVQGVREMTLDGWKFWQHVFVVAIFFLLQIFVFLHPAHRNRRVYPIYICIVQIDQHLLPQTYPN